MGRFLLLTAIGIFVSVFFMRPDGPSTTGANTTAEPSTVASTATVTVTAPPPGTGRVELLHREDGWYLPSPEAWPLVAVDRIVDGDTLDVRVSGVTLRVRVFGINTTERGEACYAEATTRLATLAGHEVRLVPDRRQQDSFGRELRYVAMPSGRSIDAAMVDEGLARAWRDDGALRSTLVSIEDEAKGAKRGCLWAG